MSDNNASSASDNELRMFESIVSTHQLSGDRLTSTKKLIEKRLTESFDGFLIKFNQANEANEIFVQVEEQGDKTKFRFEFEKKLKHPMRIDHYFTKHFEELKRGILEDAAGLLDDGLVADRRALNLIKRKIMEQMYASRESIVLHRNAVDNLLTHRQSELERLTKIEQKSGVVHANIMLGEELRTLQSAYDTLWTVQVDSKEKLVKHEETILQLNDNVQRSFESIYSLRENASIMSENHEEHIEKLMKEIAKQSKLLQKSSIKDDPNLPQSDEDPDDAGFSIKMVEDKRLGASCKGCGRFRELVKELKGALDFAREAVEINKDQKKRDSMDSKKQLKGRKMSRIGGLESKPSSRRSSKAVKSAQSSDNTKSTDEIEGEGGSLLHKIDEKVLSLFSKSTRSSRIYEHKSNRSSISSTSSRSSRLSMEFNLNSRHSSVNLDINAVEAALNHLSPQASYSDLYKKSFHGRNDISLDGGVNERKVHSSHRSMSISHRRSLSPINMHLDAVRDISLMNNMMDQFGLSLDKKEAIIRIIKEDDKDQSAMAGFSESSTQTLEPVDTLLATYLEATKEAAAMYIQSADELKLHQATNVSLKIENTLLSKQLRNSENCLHYSDSLRNLQMTERNLLLVELSDQLIVLRRKLEREEHIANHVIAHDACSVRLLDKKLIASVKRKEILLPSIKFDLLSEDSYFISGLAKPNMGRPSSSKSIDADISIYPESSKYDKVLNSQYSLKFLRSSDVGHEGLMLDGHEDGVNDIDHVINIVRKGGKMDAERLNKLKSIRKQIILLISQGSNEKDKKNLELATSKKKDSKFLGRALLVNSGFNYF